MADVGNNRKVGGKKQKKPKKKEEIEKIVKRK